MGTAQAPHLFDLTLFGAHERTAPERRGDARFALYLLIAAALHALMLVSFNSAEPKRLGAPGGADDAISVSIITEQDLKGRATVEDRAPGPPQPPAAATITAPQPPASVAPTIPQTPQAPRPAPPAQEQAPTETARAPASAPPAAAPPDEPSPSTKAPAVPAVEQVPPAQNATRNAAPKSETAPPTPGPKSDAPREKADAPKERQVAKESPPPTAKPAEPRKPSPPAKTETAKRDLTPPAIFQAPAGGGGAGVQRPAGITRSGENDDFARGVIRALQATMPQLRNTFGRVTVRITLNMEGDLAGTAVLRPSGVPGLDQSVVFATKQSSFPFPPRNAVPADLVFFVTYIYR